MNVQVTYPFDHIVDNKETVSTSSACQNYSTQSNAAPNDRNMHEVVNNFNNSRTTFTDDMSHMIKIFYEIST